MTYIVMDLEWNQARSSRDVVSDKDGNKLYGEVIQIGAVKLSDKLEISDSLKINVRPRYYKVIHRKVRQITGISQEELMHGVEFRAAMSEFRAWCGEEFAFLTWGPDDVRVLRRNIEMYGDDSSWVNNWFDLQTIYNLQTDSGDNQKSLATAIEHFEIESDEPFHDAMNDAHYTALVAEKLDIHRGISDLMQASRLRAILDEDHPLLVEVYGGYKTRREIFADREVSAIKCPSCGGVCMDMRKWVSERNDRYITLASCEEHGKFIIRLCTEKEDDAYRVSKIIYEAGGGAEKHYEKRAKKAAAKRAKRPRRGKSAAPRKPQPKSEKLEKTQK